jgi:hypothetical protein
MNFKQADEARASGLAAFGPQTILGAGESRVPLRKMTKLIGQF